MEDLSNLIAVLQRKIKERDSKIMSLEEQLQALKRGGPASSPDQSSRALALEKEVAQLKEELATARGASPSGAGAAAPLNDLVQELQRKLKKKDEEITRLKGDPSAAGALQEKLAKVEQDLAVAANARIRGEARLREVEPEVEALEAEVSAKASEVDRLKTEVEDVQTQLRLKGESADRASKQAGEADARAKKLAGEVEDAKKRLQQMGEADARVKSLEGEVTNLKGEIEKLKEDGAAKEQEASSARADAEAKEKELVAQKAKLAEKDQLLEKLQEENRLLKEAPAKGSRGVSRQAEQILLAPVPEDAKISKKPKREGVEEKAPVVLTPVPEDAKAAKKGKREVVEGKEEQEGAPPEAMEGLELAARWVCPKCGNSARGMIREETDTSVLINAYPPVYGKKLVCGQCGHSWRHK